MFSRQVFIGCLVFRAVFNWELRFLNQSLNASKQTHTTFDTQVKTALKAIAEWSQSLDKNWEWIRRVENQKKTTRQTFKKKRAGKNKRITGVLVNVSQTLTNLRIIWSPARLMFGGGFWNTKISHKNIHQWQVQELNWELISGKKSPGQIQEEKTKRTGWCEWNLGLDHPRVPVRQNNDN